MSVRVLLVTVLIGLLQIVLAYLAGVHADFPTAVGTLPGIGYLRTAHWSVSYVVLVPLVYMSSAHAVRVFMNVNGDAGPDSRRRIWIGYAAGLLFATVFVGNELWSDRMVPEAPSAYCQWNALSSACRNTSETSRQAFYRPILYAVAYGNHYLSFAAFSGFLFAMVLASEKAGRERHSQKVFRDLVDVLQIGVAAYLGYLVLLRSTKTELALSVRNASTECESLLEFSKCGRPYFEIVSNGLAFNIALGGVLILCILYCLRHLSESPERKIDVLNPVVYLKSWEVAFWSLGPRFRLVWALTMVGIAIPPPSTKMLLALLLVLSGLALARRETKAGTE